MRHAPLFNVWRRFQAPGIHSLARYGASKTCVDRRINERISPHCSSRMTSFSRSHLLRSVNDLLPKLEETSITFSEFLYLWANITTCPVQSKQHQPRYKCVAKPAHDKSQCSLLSFIRVSPAPHNRNCSWYGKFSCGEIRTFVICGNDIWWSNF